MVLTLLPGASGDQLLAALREVRRQAQSLRGGGGPGTAQGRVTELMEWTASTVRHLAYLVAASDIDRLVLPRGYELLVSAAGSMTGTDVKTQRALNGLVSVELDRRIAVLDETISALAAQVARWSRPGVFVVADTSVFIEHESKLEDLDFRPLLRIREEPVHLVVPIVVVDELDNLKNRGSDKWVKWRAGYTVGVLGKVFAGSTGPARLQAEDFTPLKSGGIPRGEVTAEMLLDTPGHTRLPIADDEIVDRALAVQALAGREVTLLTFDTGMSLRARQAGLRAEKMTKPIGDEPAKARR